MTLWIITLTTAYLLGSIPFGYLLVRFVRQEDVRSTGSGNIGATNVARAGGTTLGLFTLLLDAMKGFIAVFLGGAIAYSDRSKTALADVPSYLIDEHGAVSDAVARALAEGIRRRTGSSLALSITGIAGPATPRGPDANKPIGLVYIALTDGEDTQVKEFLIPGDRDRIRLWSTQHALEMLRRSLQ